MKSLVIIPTYNERENIVPLIERLLRLHHALHVLVVDDHSPDGTARQVRDRFNGNSRVHLLQRAEKSGIGPAYLAGFKWALKRDYEAVIEMDADFSHRPHYIPKFLQGLQRNDMVVGSRWVKGGRIYNWSWFRLLLSRAANLYAKWILQVPVHDLTGGFTAYRRQVLEALDLNRIHSDGYSFQIEMKYRALRKGFKLKEMSITFYERKAGRSKISRMIVLEAFFMVWFLKFTVAPALQRLKR